MEYMRFHATGLLAAILCMVAVTVRAELNATDSFDGSSGDWTTAWSGCSEFDGGYFTNTWSKITGAKSLGGFGNGGLNGNRVRRALHFPGGGIRVRGGFRGGYGVSRG